MNLRKSTEVNQLLCHHGYHKRYINYEKSYIKEKMGYDLEISFYNSNCIVATVYAISWGGYNRVVEVVHSVTSIEQLQNILKKFDSNYQ